MTRSMILKMLFWGDFCELVSSSFLAKKDSLFLNVIHVQIQFDSTLLGDKYRLYELRVNDQG